jgi:threonine synthase
VPLVCLETALPVKFGATIREALGRDPARPAASTASSSGRSASSCCPPTRPKVKAIIEESAAA